MPTVRLSSGPLLKEWTLETDEDAKELFDAVVEEIELIAGFLKFIENEDKKVNE